MANRTRNSKELPRGAWPVVGCRMHPDERRIVNMAAVVSGINRSDFMRQVLLTAAQKVLDGAA